MSVYMQEYEENPSLLYSTAHPRGVIQPYSTEEIPLVLQAKTVGQLQLTALIAILGSQDPPLVSMCVCVHSMRQRHRQRYLTSAYFMLTVYFIILE